MALLAHIVFTQVHCTKNLSAKRARFRGNSQWDAFARKIAGEPKGRENDRAGLRKGFSWLRCAAVASDAAFAIIGRNSY
jgi:hypothetical protein